MALCYVGFKIDEIDERFLFGSVEMDVALSNILVVG